MRGILAQRNAREISEQAPIPGRFRHTFRMRHTVCICKAVVKCQTSEPVLNPCFDNDALIMRSGGGRTIWTWNAYICRRVSRDYPRSLMLYSGPFKVWYPLQDTAARYGFPWIFLKTLYPLEISLVGICFVNCVFFTVNTVSTDSARQMFWAHKSKRSLHNTPQFDF